MRRQTRTTGGAGNLQPVQDEDLRGLNLPPSIPVSRDGEEGIVVYSLRLQQSNADARTECYQAPPNRTVDAAGAGGGFGAGAILSPQHSTSTQLLPQPPKLTRREVAASLAKFRSVMGSKPARLHAQQMHHHSHPQQKQQQQQQQQPSDAADYVSSYVLSSWRTTSPDRLERSSVIIPSMGPLPPPYPTDARGGGAGGGTGGGGGGEAGASGGIPVDEKAALGKRPKQRSSSADSVRRLVAKCSLLRFTKKHATPPSAKPSVTIVSVDTQKAFDSASQLDESLSPGGAKEQEAPPWELPPNYVDMIFTKDPATIDNKKENIIKQQQQQQRHEQRQQRQPQHCCFNS